MIWRGVYLLTIVAMLTGITHILIVLFIPDTSTRDAWSNLSAQTRLYTFTPLKKGGDKAALASSDPFFEYGICRFDLNEAGLKIDGPKINGFWSASVFDENGKVIYSLSDRSTIDDRLNLVVLSPLDALELKQVRPEEAQSTIIVETDIRFGFAIFRLLSPDPSRARQIQTALSQMNCSPFQVE